ncbi:unnamed protein product [marine sediment metagenome]|uniref:Ribbon-helix-helix protein CopG domain-containing protein n=1 Tax=marine sediment metagenome TaxID=412755 RepID=X1E864_9ZZZZ
MKYVGNKTRLSVTMTKPYIDALDSLVEKGIHLERGDAVLEALRDFFIKHGCPLTTPLVPEPEE